MVMIFLSDCSTTTKGWLATQLLNQNKADGPCQRAFFYFLMSMVTFYSSLIFEGKARCLPFKWSLLRL